MRMSSCPLPSLGTVGSGLGHEAEGTQRQFVVPVFTMLGTGGQVAETSGGTRVPTISCRVRTTQYSEYSEEPEEQEE